MDQSKPAAPTEPADDENALETPEGGNSPAPSDSNAANVTDATNPNAVAPAAPPPRSGGIKHLLRVLNIYLLLFGLILVIAGVIIGIAYFQSKKASVSTIKTQSLSSTALQQLANSDATVGDPKQVLNVQSNAVFAGKVLVRSTLEVAGGIQVGGNVSLGGLTVSGTSTFDQIQVNKNLQVAGDTAIQGALSVNKSLQVNGSGTFNGALSATQITTSVFQLNGDLVLTHHITAGGPSPSRSPGPAVGSGGTAGVSGSDTSGTITVNTGNGPVAGCFISVSFATKYATVPHVIVSPVGPSAGGLAYYVDRTSGGFSLCDASVPPAGSSFAFDYWIVD